MTTYWFCVKHGTDMFRMEDCRAKGCTDDDIGRCPCLVKETPTGATTAVCECGNCGNIEGGAQCTDCKRKRTLRDSWTPRLGGIVPARVLEAHTCVPVRNGDGTLTCQVCGRDVEG